MKNILQVFKFEYLSCIKNKAFIITTVILMVIILALSFLPAIIMGIFSDSNYEEGQTPKIAISDQSYHNDKLVKDEFSKYYKDYDIIMSDESKDELKAKVDSTEYDFAVVINSPIAYEYITKNNSLMDETYSSVNDIIASIYKITALEKYGITSSQANDILNVQIQYSTIITGVDQTQNYLSTYILIMVLYMAILMYGQLVSNSVITEKNSRAMEMLITCAKPSELMFGKIFGAGLGGLTQLVLIVLAGIVSMSTIGASSIPNELISFISFPISTVLFALLFFILGFFIFAFMLGALSSLASRTEDLNTIITPVMFIYIAAFMIVIFSMNTDNIDSPFMVVCSYIPFTAPPCMFARICMTDVAVWEIILSVVTQLITIYLLGMLASAIYKIGVLMYGKPPKFSELISMLKEQYKQNKLLKK